MKPIFKYSLLGVGLVALAAGSYFVFFSGRGDKLQKYIPDNASLVVKIDPKSILNGLDLEALKKSESFEKAIADMKDKSDPFPALLSQSMSNPKETGINWLKPSYVFMRTEKGVTYTAFLLSVNDPNLLKSCINDHVKDHEDIDLEDNQYFMKVRSSEYWGWNKEVLMILSMRGRRQKDLISDHLNLTYEANISSKEEMAEILNKKAAVSWCVNGKTLPDALESMRGGITPFQSKMFGDFAGGTLEFKDGEIVMDAVQKGAKSFIESKSNKSFNTTPNGIVPFFHMSYALKINPLIDYLLQDKNTSESMGTEVMNSELMSYLKELGNGFSMQMWNQGSPAVPNMENPLLSGNLGMAMRVGLAEQSPKLDSSLALFNLGLNSYMQRLADNSSAYAFDETEAPQAASPLPIALNKENGMMKLVSGLHHDGSYKIWRDKRLPDDFFDQPFQIWIDFDEDHFPYWMLEQNMSSRERAVVMRNMKRFSHVVASGTTERSTFKLVMKDQKENALAQILEMVLDAAKNGADI
jgi:hypothetical protein